LQLEDPQLTKLKDFAITEVFNYYVRKHLQEKAQDFEH
jgi:hypothetical protein